MLTAYRVDRSVLVLAIGLMLSIAIHASVLALARGDHTAPFRVPAPMEMQIFQTRLPDPPRPVAPEPKRQPIVPKTARKIVEAVAAPEVAEPKAKPPPLLIPGLRMTPGIGQTPVPPGNIQGPNKRLTDDKALSNYVPPGSADREPEVAHEFEIPYPEDARRAGLEGVVRMRITIDEQGRVIEARVLSGPGPSLNEAARGAILKFKFKAAQKAGAPVSTSMIYQYTFALE